MKASLHLGHGRAKHNDRSFDIEKAEHIDNSKTEENITHRFINEHEAKSKTLGDYELSIYDRRYRKALDETNAKYLSNRHPERCKKMSDWYDKFSPVEAILQIGNRNENPDYQILKKAFVQTSIKMKAKYPQMLRLDFSLHLDEATPHIHFRFVIEGHDKSGNIKPLKAQGLREMGVPLPDPSKPEGRYNNRMQTFTAEMREIFYMELEKLGIELDRVVRPENEHVSTLLFKQKKEAEKLKKIQDEITISQEILDERTNEIETLSTTYEDKMNALEDEYSHRQQQINEQEKQLAGRMLMLNEVLDLKQKSIWSAEDKDNIIKTAVASAQNAEEAKLNRQQNKSLEQQLSALKDTNEQLQNLRNNLEDQLLLLRPQEILEDEIKFKDQEIVSLKEDIRIRDKFIIENGLQARFIESLKNLGHKLTIAIGSLSNSLRIK